MIRKRISPGTTLEEVVEQLTIPQRRALEAAVQAREDEPILLREVKLRALTRTAEALEEGVPARALAGHLGVTLARVYQMKDEANAARSSAGVKA